MAEADPQIDESEAATPAAPTPAPARRRWGRLGLMLALPVALLIGGFVYWQGLQGKVGTDNAYLKQDKVGVSAEIVGKVVDVRVREGQLVQAGDLLFRIDPEPYRLQIAEADAAIATAQANVTALSSASELTGADIAAAREDIAFEQATLNRQEELWRRGPTSRRRARGWRKERRFRARTRKSPPPRRAGPKPSWRCGVPKCAPRSLAGSPSRIGCNWANRQSPACRC